MDLTNEQLIEMGRKVAERASKQKAYDRWYMAKAKHELNELRRIVKENDLESQMQAFDRTQEDFQD